jgi:hypothetical protein
MCTETQAEEVWFWSPHAQEGKMHTLSLVSVGVDDSSRKNMNVSNKAMKSAAQQRLAGQ